MLHTVNKLSDKISPIIQALTRTAVGKMVQISKHVKMFTENFCCETGGIFTFTDDGHRASAYVNSCHVKQASHHCNWYTHGR